METDVCSLDTCASYLNVYICIYRNISKGNENVPYICGKILIDT